jgi:hypothetical protein
MERVRLTVRMKSCRMRLLIKMMIVSLGQGLRRFRISWRRGKRWELERSRLEGQL